MTFAFPHLLWLLLVPVALGVADRARRLAADAESWPTIRRLWAGPGGLAPSRFGAKHPRRWRLWLGLMLLVVALARPQWGKIEEHVFDQSREVLIALDLSRSMLATDVKPTRLERSRLLVESLLERLKGERVGLLVFSGTAFLQCPLSPDYEVLREFLPALNPDYLPEGGTDYARLLKAALEAFSNEAGADRYLIILSDGEALTEDWRAKLDTLTQRGIRVIALGVGTESGSMIPAKDGGFVKDERGAVVLSKLNPTTLKQLASATGGAYAEASGWLDLPALLQQTVDRGRKGALNERKTIRLGERFQWFLAPAVLLLLLSYWHEFPVSPKPRDFRRRTAAHAAALLGALLCLLPRDLSAANLAQPRAGQTPQIQLQPAAAQPPPSELPKIVEQLAAQPTLSAADCEKLARETITHGQAVRQSGQPIKPGIVQDGLAAVDRGESLDAKAADWPGLRSQLQELLRPPEQQEQKKDEQKQEEKKQEQQQQQSQDKKQDQQQEQKSEEQKQQEQQQQQSQAQPQPQQDQNTQKLGGAQDEDKERQEHPELAMPLQKLDQVREKDSPAELFELLHDNEPRPANQPKKDW
jgi:Ca-activated chloride channel family protein